MSSLMRQQQKYVKSHIDQPIEAVRQLATEADNLHQADQDPTSKGRQTNSGRRLPEAGRFGSSNL